MLKCKCSNLPRATIKPVSGQRSSSVNVGIGGLALVLGLNSRNFDFSLVSLVLINSAPQSNEREVTGWSRLHGLLSNGQKK
jgi:hypothetical protein